MRVKINEIKKTVPLKEILSYIDRVILVSMDRTRQTLILSSDYSQQTNESRLGGYLNPKNPSWKTMDKEQYELDYNTLSSYYWELFFPIIYMNL